MTKYYIAYKYNRSEIKIIDNQEKLVQWDTESSDVFNVPFEVKTMEDKYKLDFWVLDILKKECKVRNQEVNSLLIQGIFKLEG